MGGDAKTRRNIREKAKDLFKKSGFARATIAEIANACEMSPANLYRHYRNKRAIAFAVAVDAMRARSTELQSVLDQPAETAELRLRRALTTIADQTIRSTQEEPRLLEISELLFDSREGRRIIEILQPQFREMMKRLILDGVANGEFRVSNPDVAAQATLVCMRYFSLPFAIAHFAADNIRDELAAAIELIVAGLRGGVGDPHE